jgi:phosphatidylserine decarboxylase
MPGPQDIIERLRKLLTDDPGLEQDLERSLVEAGARAEDELDADVYQALDWPTSIAEYEGYLQRFIRWIPRQSDNKAWTKHYPHERLAKEVSDRIAHFFWLVDQPVHDGDAPAVEKSEAFGDWLTEFARQWGGFLDTPESFSREILDSFMRDAPEYRVEESLVDHRPNAPSGWLTFNQFFARELNAGLRPVSDPHDNHVVTSPADCSYQHTFAIGADSEIPPTTLFQDGARLQVDESDRFRRVGTPAVRCDRKGRPRP